MKTKRNNQKEIATCYMFNNFVGTYRIKIFNIIIDTIVEALNSIYKNSSIECTDISC